MQYSLSKFLSEWLSVAVACLPSAVSLLLLEVLFMQISGVSLALTWPHRLCLLEISCVQATAISFPLSKHTGGGDTAPPFSGLRVCLQLTREVGLPPSPVEFSSFRQSHKLSRSWLLGVCHCSHPLCPGPACLFTVPGRIPHHPLWCSGRPTLFATLFLLLIIQFLFFPWVGVGLSRGLC
jgi:hypothetical protein